ncbi:MAG: hypothetical protein M3340_20485, partial [Actinomycetota bacterium]|nr:hypothetical protein [Actinomycetota bacterium]
MSKYLIAILAAATLVVGTAIAGTSGGDDPVTIDPSAATSTTEQPGEISGPCDEAEHANDPRCTGAAGARAEDGEARGDDRRERREDDEPGEISGPCDEAEHANDPRCT